MKTIDFVKHQLLELFPDVDLSPGSPVDRDLIQPLRSRLGDELLGVSAGEIIRARLATEYPEMSGIQTEDLLVKPADLILEPLRQIIGRLNVQTSTNDLLNLTDDELDAVVGTLFIYRTIGTYAEYRMRLYVNNPRPIVLGPDNICRTASGLSFYPKQVYTYHVPDIMSNREGNLYYVEFNATAAGRGARYNVALGDISTITGVTDAVRVKNTRKITDGQDTETNDELLARVSTMLGERALVTDSGIVAKIDSLSNGSLRRISVVGHRDPDMLRDVLSASITVRDNLFGEPYAGGTTGNCPNWVSSNGLTYVGYSDTLNASYSGAFEDTVIGDEISVMNSSGDFGHGTVQTVVSDTQVVVTGLDEILTGIGHTVEIEVGTDAAEMLISDTFQDAAGTPLETLTQGGDTLLAVFHYPGKYISGTDADTIFVGSQRISILQACDSAATRAKPNGANIVEINTTIDPNVQAGDFITLQRGVGEHSMHRITAVYFSAQQLYLEPNVGWSSASYDTKWTIHRNGADQWDPLTGLNKEYFDWTGAAWGWDDAYVIIDVENPLPAGSPVSWTAHRNSTDSIVATLTLNDMPGGILLTDNLEYVPGEVHVGGCADAYVVDDGRTGYSITMNGITGIDMIIDGSNMGCTIDSDAWSSPVNFLAAGVRAGDVLVIPDTYGSIAGSYIIRHATTGFVYTTETAPATQTGIDFQIVRTITTPLDRPRDLVDSGGDLVLSVFTEVVTFGHNVTAQGVQPGNVLRVTVGDAEPFEFTIVSIEPGGLQATVNSLPPVNAVNAYFEVWNTYAGEGAVTRPIIEVTDVTIGDYTVPYARPVLCLLVSLSRYNQKAPTEVKRTPYVRISQGSTDMYFLHNHPYFYDVEEGDYILVNSIQFQVESIDEVEYRVTVTEEAALSIDYRPAIISSPQTGTMRMYFKDPTEGWVDPDTVFTLRSDSDYTMHPDDRAYRLIYQGIDGATDTIRPGMFDTNDDTFPLYRAENGDYLVIESKAIRSGAIPGGEAAVSGKYLRFTVDGEVKNIVFAGTDPIQLSTYTDFGGIVQQINAANIGVTATEDEVGGNRYLVLSSSLQVTLTGNVSAAIDLQFTASSYTNVSLFSGTYLIDYIDPTIANLITLSDEDGVIPEWATIESGLSYKVYRRHAKEIDLETMRETNTELGLYYTDVPVSADFLGTSGPVSVYDEFDCDGETTFGYWFTTGKESVVGSIYEEVNLHVTATFPDIEGPGGLIEQLPAAGESLVVKYKGSSTLVSTQYSMLGKSNRNVVASMMLMHKFPAYVRFFFEYTGGSAVSIIRSDLTKLLNTSSFIGRVTAYEVGRMLVQRHAIDGVEPVTMMKLSFDRSRKWYASLSQDRLVFGSLEFPVLDWDNSTITAGSVLVGALAGYGAGTTYS